MSYRAILDMTLSIDSFRNVGMFQQGVYFMTYQIYYFKDSIYKIYASPYANIPFIYSAKQEKSNFRSLEQSEILLNEPTFKTRAFSIRFKHEEIPMNEVCQFRAEVDADKYGEFQDTVFFIETKLYFLRFKFTSSTTQKYLVRMMKEKRDEFKQVSTQTFKLNGCMRGMTEYVPTTFKGVYFSVSHGILHTALTNFKWREKTLLPTDGEMDNDGIYVVKDGKLSFQEEEKLNTEHSYLPSDLQDFLLGSKRDFYEKHKTNSQTIENVFDVFIALLIQNWENLKRTYETVLFEEKDTILDNSKPLSKLEPSAEDLEFCGQKGWKRFTKEEAKLKQEEKENQPIEQEQANLNESSDEEGNFNIEDEEFGIQKVYTAIVKPKEFYLNYNELKKTFVERVKTKNPNGLTKNIETELNMLAGQVLQ